MSIPQMSDSFLKVGDTVRVTAEGLSAIYDQPQNMKSILNATMLITEIEPTEVPTNEGPAFIVHTNFKPFDGFLLFDWFFRKA